MSVLIHVVDAQTDELLDYVTEENFWDDNLEQSTENQLDAFEFTTFANSPFAEHLTKRNRLVIPNHYGVLSEYIIEENEQNIDREKTVYATASYIELAKVRWIPPGTTQAVGVKQHAEAALLDTEWTLGEAPEVGTTTFTFDEYTDALSYLRAVAEAFDLELSFHVEHNGYQITKRVVDFNVVEREFEGYEVVFGKDAQEITRTERSADVVTKLIGLGPNPSDENAERLVVEVEDLDALERWGRGGKHLIGLFTPEGNGEGTTIEQLYEQTRKRLDDLINSQVTYDVQFVNLYDIFGMDRRMTLGEVVRVKDEYFNPPLYVDARVHTISGSIKDGGIRSIALGDFIEYAQSDIMSYFNALRGEVNGKLDEYQLYEYVGMYAEKKIIKSAVPPTDLTVVWLDTSVVPNVFKTWNGTEWVKATPTEAHEVGAATVAEAEMAALLAALESEQIAMMTTYYNVKATYQSNYNSVYILGLPIQAEIQTKYDAFVSAHNTLYNLISDVVLDGNVSDTEKTSLETSRSAYQTSVDEVMTSLANSTEEIRTAQKASQESFVQEYYGKRITQGTLAPTNPQTGDLWIDYSTSPYTWKRWDGAAWVNAVAVSLEDLQGELDGARMKTASITGGKIESYSITANQLAANSVTSNAIAANSITSTMIATVGLDAGVIKFGTMSGERILSNSITADKISGGTITGVTINVTTDLNVGNNIYLGALTSNANKSIKFGGATGGGGGIDYLYSSDKVRVWAINRVSLEASTIDFAGASSIDWGSNKPTAVWG